MNYHKEKNNSSQSNRKNFGNCVIEYCPNCKNNLGEHSNEQLQQCAFNELSKINRKSITFDPEYKSQSNETPIAGGVTSG